MAMHTSAWSILQRCKLRPRKLLPSSGSTQPHVHSSGLAELLSLLKRPAPWEQPAWVPLLRVPQFP